MPKQRPKIIQKASQAKQTQGNRSFISATYSGHGGQARPAALPWPHLLRRRWDDNLGRDRGFFSGVFLLCIRKQECGSRMNWWVSASRTCGWKNVVCCAWKISFDASEKFCRHTAQTMLHYTRHWYLTINSPLLAAMLVFSHHQLISHPICLWSSHDCHVSVPLSLHTAAGFFSMKLHTQTANPSWKILEKYKTVEPSWAMWKLI